jgi:hypothetical protein
MIRIIIGLGLGIYIGIEYTEEIKSILQIILEEVPF